MENRLESEVESMLNCLAESEFFRENKGLKMYKKMQKNKKNKKIFY